MGRQLLGVMSKREGLPRPDWDAIAERYEQLPESQRLAAWSAMERQWQEALAAAWDGFSLYASGNWLLTTDMSVEIAERLQASLHDATVRVERMLGGVGLGPIGDPERFVDWPGHDIAVVCRDRDTYVDYISDSFPDAYTGGMSGGVCIADGAGHIVAWGQDESSLQATLAHEIAHTRLSLYGIPLWFEEGLVMLLESSVTRQRWWEPTRELVEEHQRYWNADRLDRFFRGDGGFDSVDDGYALAYGLAAMLVQQLLDRGRKRMSPWVFALEGGDMDGACRSVYGCELTDLLPAFVRST
ncbi:MAG: hypothetical protein AAGH92_06130 [Planctomycetota bacterium]